MFGLFKKKEKPKPEASRIVPRIKNDQFEPAIRAHGVPDDQIPVIEPLVGDLFVTYAFDLDDAFMMVTRDHLADLGLRAEDLREIAVANFRAKSPNARVVKEGALHRVVVGDNLDACALLSSKLWTSVAGDFPNGLVAMVPNRDILLYCDAGDAGPRKALATNGAVAFATGGTHALSVQLMRWTGNGWSVD